jgi:hypothetical protein
MPSQTGDLRRESSGNSIQASLPGPTGWIAPLLGEQGTQLPYLGCWLLHDGQQGVDGSQVAHNHDHQCP